MTHSKKCFLGLFHKYSFSLLPCHEDHSFWTQSQWDCCDIAMIHSNGLRVILCRHRKLTWYEDIDINCPQDWMAHWDTMSVAGHHDYVFYHDCHKKSFIQIIHLQSMITVRNRLCVKWSYTDSTEIEGRVVLHHSCSSC